MWVHPPAADLQATQRVVSRPRFGWVLPVYRTIYISQERIFTRCMTVSFDRMFKAPCAVCFAAVVLIIAAKGIQNELTR